MPVDWILRKEALSAGKKFALDSTCRAKPVCIGRKFTIGFDATMHLVIGSAGMSNTQAEKKCKSCSRLAHIRLADQMIRRLATLLSQERRKQ